MTNMPYIQQDDAEELSEAEKLDQALHDVEMIYRSRCVDVPLTSNVKVTEVGEEKKDKETQSEN